MTKMARSLILVIAYCNFPRAFLFSLSFMLSLFKYVHYFNRFTIHNWGDFNKDGGHSVSSIHILAPFFLIPVLIILQQKKWDIRHPTSWLVCNSCLPAFIPAEDRCGILHTFMNNTKEVKIHKVNSVVRLCLSFLEHLHWCFWCQF